MRLRIVLLLTLAALPAMAFTPELGKNKLRHLIKLPSISFPGSWTFDPESGFTLGSGDLDTTTRISKLRSQLKHDSSDAERYTALARLYSADGQFANAGRSWTRAVDLFRKRLESHPEDGVLMAGLGEALQGVGKTQEAESLLRRATQTSPGQWQCWVALGRFLDSDARRNIEQPSRISPNADEERTSNAASGQPSTARVALAQRRLAEAAECFDKAAALAPAESEVFLRRALHRSLGKMLENRIRVAAGEQKDELDVLFNCFSPESLADMQKASRLDPENPRLVAGAALFEIYTVCSRNGQVKWDELQFSTLPDDTQKSFREIFARLQNLGEDPDPQSAAGALELLGILEGPLLHEPQRAIVDFRRAVALDPSREHSWEMLSSMLARGSRFSEMLSVCEDRVRLKNSMRGHILLAKAFERLGQWEDCEENVLAALNDGPNDFALNLAYAALLLRRSQDYSSLSDANDWLLRAELLASKAPNNQRTHQQIIDLTLTRSIYFALADDVDAARQWANSVISQDKENKIAREILSAIDY